MTNTNQFIDHLRNLPTCTEYIRSFLDLIQTEMLVLKTTNDRERGRIGAVELVSRLNSIWQKCQNAKFATMSARKSKRSRDPQELDTASGKRKRL